MSTITEDPDVDILMSGNLLKVLIDLRGQNLKSENLIVKADKQGVYVFDKESNNVIKVIKLPTLVDPNSFSLSEKFGTYVITLKRK